MHLRRASGIAGCRFARREQSDLISVKAGIRARATMASLWRDR